ncbi:MAG: adenylosuccinate lyase [Desulfamplus sp.]|nr:adenylosuccinate lyase [Desulfamplus sp.]
MESSLKAISVLDGRYKNMTAELKDIFSEYGLIRNRVYVELEWLKFIIKDLKLTAIQSDSGTKIEGTRIENSTKTDLARSAIEDKGIEESKSDDEAVQSVIDKLQSVLENFNESDAQKIKDIEKTTNHDVKAVEYFIKEKLVELGLSDIMEWVHFACTSDDINNISYALMVRQGRDIAASYLSDLLGKIEEKALEYKAVPMMGRTHGQPATPTTVGKEFVNFAWRLNYELSILKSAPMQAKINGATGNYNAHFFVFPEIDWIAAGQRFLSQNLGLEPLLFTTQINPSAYLSFILHSMVRSAAVTIDFDRDMWGYISLGYFRQRLKKGETGSSTMPHKVNPIDFENSEGNMGLAISMMEHLAVKLQKSRFQRDLSDSTVLRSLGSVFGYYLIGIKNAMKGLGKIAVDADTISKDLDANQELLAEPFQTAMRVYGEENPYERLKDLTRGQRIGKKDLEDFVNTLEKVPEMFREKMRNLTPAGYTGVAQNLVDKYFSVKQHI